VHLIDSCGITGILLAPLWKQLLTKQEYQVSDISVFGELFIFPGVQETSLNLVKQGTAH
jgi:hypothetical protein